MEFAAPGLGRAADSAEQLADVTAAILVGGAGTRLRAVVNDRPKVLAELRGRPFVAFLLDQLNAAGLRHVVLCTGYRGAQIRDALGESHGPTRLSYSHEETPLDTAGAVRLALPLLESQSVLVMNGDSYFDIDLRAMWSWHSRLGAQVTLAVASVPDVRPFGRVALTREGRVLRFAEKTSQAGPGRVNAGIYLIRRPVLESIPRDRPISLERDMLPAWVDQGVWAYRSAARLLDIGIPETYATADSLLAQVASV